MVGKMIPVRICVSGDLYDEDVDACHYGYWSIDSKRKRLVAVCEHEERFIKIFGNEELSSDKFGEDVSIPDWCPLEDMK